MIRKSHNIFFLFAFFAFICGPNALFRFMAGVHIVLVVHGPAVDAFNDIEATDNVRNALARLAEQGVELGMCGNTLDAFDVEIDELLPGFVEIPQGGVTRIAELRSQGYVYIRS